MKKNSLVIISLCLSFLCCNSQAGEHKTTDAKENRNADAEICSFDSSTKTIHIFVALCDNKYQGIVPVPAKIGNGQDPNNNLYWGCAFGVKTFFKKSAAWKLIKSESRVSPLLERLIFIHATKLLFSGRRL